MGPYDSLRQLQEPPAFYETGPFCCATISLWVCSPGLKSVFVTIQLVGPEGGCRVADRSEDWPEGTHRPERRGLIRASGPREAILGRRGRHRSAMVLR